MVRFLRILQRTCRRRAVSSVVSQPASERAATSDLNNFIIIVISLVYERVVLNTDRIYTRETTAHSKGLHNILFCFVAISERTSSRQIS